MCEPGDLIKQLGHPDEYRPMLPSPHRAKIAAEDRALREESFVMTAERMIRESEARGEAVVVVTLTTVLSDGSLFAFDSEGQCEWPYQRIENDDDDDDDDD